MRKSHLWVAGATDCQIRADALQTYVRDFTIGLLGADSFRLEIIHSELLRFATWEFLFTYSQHSNHLVKTLAQRPYKERFLQKSAASGSLEGCFSRPSAAAPKSTIHRSMKLSSFSSSIGVGPKAAWYECIVFDKAKSA